MFDNNKFSHIEYTYKNCVSNTYESYVALIKIYHLNKLKKKNCVPNIAHLIKN